MTNKVLINERRKKNVCRLCRAIPAVKEGERTDAVSDDISTRLKIVLSITYTSDCGLP